MIETLPGGPIKGLVEIGYPGRFIPMLQSKIKITGKIIAVYEKPSLTDYIQTGFPRPYHEFAPLDYKKPNLKALEAASADVITCFVGLHHFPEEELIPFLKEIKRILRPEGHFLLVDHDVQTPEDALMARLAHSVFNVVTGESLENETKEIRNFHPLTYWIEQLQKVGLNATTKSVETEYIRKDDPSRNRMVAFQKPELPKRPHLSVVDVNPTSFPSPIAAPHLVPKKPAVDGPSYQVIPTLQ